MNNQASNEWRPAAEVENFNPNRYDFVWNADYSLFRAVPLRWHDDASYAAYQAAEPQEVN